MHRAPAERYVSMAHETHVDNEDVTAGCTQSERVVCDQLVGVDLHQASFNH